MNEQPLEGYQLVQAPGHLLRRCQQRAVEIFYGEVGRKGPTPRQFAVMLTVRQTPGINQTEVVRRTGIDRSTIGDLISRMERRRWLRRRRAGRDARAHALYLTSAGEAALKQAAPAVEAAQRRILAPLPEKDRAHFLDCLRLIADLPAPDGGSR
jgi:DNA-binding MarR family transcriptional regulator